MQRGPSQRQSVSEPLKLELCAFWVRFWLGFGWFSVGFWLAGRLLRKFFAHGVNGCERMKDHESLKKRANESKTRGDHFALATLENTVGACWCS